jgi:hypothetical protein
MRLLYTQIGRWIFVFLTSFFSFVTCPLVYAIWAKIYSSFWKKRTVNCSYGFLSCSFHMFSRPIERLRDCLIKLMFFFLKKICIQRERGWRTFKRPGVDAFLEHLGKFYEIVVYSDQLSMVSLLELSVVRLYQMWPGWNFVTCAVCWSCRW